MADLCGGHPADVLIAVCLAAQTLTVPGMEIGAMWNSGWAGGQSGWKEGAGCLGSSWTGDSLGKVSGEAWIATVQCTHVPAKPCIESSAVHTPMKSLGGPGMDDTVIKI